MYIDLCIIKCVYECMRLCDELCVTMERSASQETLQVSFNTNSIRCFRMAPSLHSNLCLLIQFKASQMLFEDAVTPYNIVSSGSPTRALPCRFRVCIVVISVYHLRHVRLSVCLSPCLSACTSTAATGWISVKFDIGFFRENLLMYVSYPKQLTLRDFFRSMNILFRSSWSRHRVAACTITIICEKLARLILKLRTGNGGGRFLHLPLSCDLNELNPRHNILLRYDPL